MSRKYVEAPKHKSNFVLFLGLCRKVGFSILESRLWFQLDDTGVTGTRIWSYNYIGKKSCKIAIHSLFCELRILQEVSQIHTMFLSAKVCLWISKLFDRCVNSHVAKKFPSDSTAVHAEECKLLPLMSTLSYGQFFPINSPFVCRCNIAWGHLGLLSLCFGQTKPSFVHFRLKCKKIWGADRFSE